MGSSVVSCHLALCPAWFWTGTCSIPTLPVEGAGEVLQRGLLPLVHCIAVWVVTTSQRCPVISEALSASAPSVFFLELTLFTFLPQALFLPSLLSPSTACLPILWRQPRRCLCGNIYIFTNKVWTHPLKALFQICPVIGTLLPSQDVLYRSLLSFLRIWSPINN